MKRFNQFLEFANSLIDWIRDRVDPVSENERLKMEKEILLCNQKYYLERCLTLEYRVTPRH